jgi:DNA-binding NarL/FixJ family response regulator
MRVTLSNVSGRDKRRSIAVLLVDDHVLVRDGLRRVLETQPDITVVGEAGDSRAAVGQAARHQPDVVLLDVEIPGDEATVTVGRIAEVSPASAVIILSMYDGPDLLRRLLAAGIRGYLLKSAGRDELVAAIRGARQSGGPVMLWVSGQSLVQVQGLGDAVLTPREAAVLRLAAEALTNSQIARRLDLSEAMVKREMRRIFAKLGAVSRIDAVNKAVAASLITPHRDNQRPTDR